jgi:outer membrane protein assembly factor BamB
MWQAFDSFRRNPGDMRTTPSLRAALAAALVGGLLAGSAASAAPAGCDTRAKAPGGDWPTVGGSLAQTSYQRAERAISRATVSRMTLKWVSSAPVNPGQGSPVVAGSCVFVTGLGTVYALDAGTGRLVWRTGPNPLPYNGDGFLSYPPQGVSVFNGRVHLGSDNKSAPVGIAYDARTGGLLWKSRPITFGYRATQLSVPKVFDGMQLLFTTGPDFDAHGRPGYALLDERTGRVITRRTTLEPQMLKEGYAGGGVWATAAIDPVGKYAYVGTSNPYTKTKESPYDNAIIRIDLDRRRKTFGQVVQSYKGVPDVFTPLIYNQPVCQTLGPIAPTTVGAEAVCLQQDADFGIGPVLFRNKAGRLLLAEEQKDGTLHVLDAHTMARQVSLLLGTNNNLTLTGGNMSMPMWDGERLVVAANPGTLYGIDPDSGEIDWAVPLQDGYTVGRPIVGANGVAFTLAGSDSTVVAHDTSTGLPLGVLTPSVDTGQQCAAGQTGGMAIAHHTLYVNCGGYLAAYGLEG